jgi:Cu/Zn superoxide dismutase
VILGALAALVLVVPASAGGAQVTRGEFHEFAAGAGMHISGHAVMVRTADGRTLVSVHVEGLAAATYGSHVHRLPCDTRDAAGNLAGGHYKYDPAGLANDLNEIWPGFTSNAAGIGNGNARNDWTAGPTAVSVVIHAPGGARIACADLE